MSGPKLSAAEIAAAERRRLEEQRRLALEQLRKAQEKLSQARAQRLSIFNQAYASIGTLGQLYRQQARQQLDALLAQHQDISVSGEKDPQLYLSAAQTLSRSNSQLSKELDHLLEKYMSRDRVQQTLSQNDQLHQSYQSFLNEKDDPVDVRKLDFSSHYDQLHLQALVSRMTDHYRWLGATAAAPEMKVFADQSVKWLQQASAAPEQLQKGMQSLINTEEELRRRIEQMAQLYQEYSAAAILADITPDPPSSFTSAAALSSAIDQLNDQLRQKDEMDFIADQINDAMVSLGYGLLASHVMTRKDHSETDVTLYKADDRTGVAVYTDQSGAVMMQMTLLGSDSTITASDQDFSYQQQIAFCYSHPDIIKALEARGVLLKQNSYMEPDKKYTYKINLSQNAGTINTAVGNKIDRRKRRRGKKNKMRAM